MADVINLDDHRPAEPEQREWHYDVPLDAEPQPGGQPVQQPDPVTETRAPIVPGHLRTARGVRGAARRHTGLILYRAGYHLLRLPRYTVLALFWSVVGVGVFVARQIRWWWVLEQHQLRQEAANSNDPMTWMQLHRDAKRTRAWRGTVLLGELLGLVVLAVTTWSGATPWWVLVPLAAAAVVLLAHLGHPVDKPIISPAVVSARHRRINPDVVLRAYYSAGLGNPDKEDKKIDFGSAMARDVSDTGSQVVMQMPYGTSYSEVIKAKEKLASGLDVSINQLFITRDHTSNRRHLLFVADRDPLALPAGRTPLLDGKVRDIWRPAPFGRDERDRQVTLLLMWISVLIGAQPRKGKTFSARLLALYAAMDPWVKIFGVDGKNSPDWRSFALVAEQMVYGTHMSRDGDPVEKLLHLLRDIKAHIIRVNEVLATVPSHLCPEGKLTRELARDPRYPDLRVWLLIMEEFQVYYELDDKDASDEIASLLSFIMAVGPSAGVIILSSSQKPSGVGGSGNAKTLFTRYRDNHTARFALKCGSRTVSEAILGTEAYGEGYDAASLPSGDQYRGVGYLYGLTDDVPTVRTYLADAADAEKILRRARELREQAGLLSGEAAGETITRQRRDVLADVAGIFQAGEPGLQWGEVADRLRERMAEHYADVDAETISAQMRGLNIPSVDIKRSGISRKGCRAEAIRAAMDRRVPA